ncbi:hypothetical protein ACF0H5_020051 [Mactra antiquata]
MGKVSTGVDGQTVVLPEVSLMTKRKVKSVTVTKGVRRYSENGSDISGHVTDSDQSDIEPLVDSEMKICAEDEVHNDGDDGDIDDTGEIEHDLEPSTNVNDDNGQKTMMNIMKMYQSACVSKETKAGIDDTVSSSKATNKEAPESSRPSDKSFMDNFVLKQDGDQLGLYTNIKIEAGRLIGPISTDTIAGECNILPIETDTVSSTINDVTEV